MMRISEVRGVALVSVLLIVALVAALAWRMVTQHQLTVAHTRHSCTAVRHAITPSLAKSTLARRCSRIGR